MSDVDVVNPGDPIRRDPVADENWRRSTPLPPPPSGGAPALAPQSPLSTLGPPPAPTAGPPPKPQLNTPPMPARPEEQKLGPAPDAKEYHKGALEFASAMAVLGAVASAFTRRSGTAALSAFAGALNGWQSGNLQQYEEAAKKWEQDTKATIENNRQITEKYREALAERKMNIDEQMAHIQLIATQYHDQIMYDAAAAKNYTMVAQIYEKNAQFTQKAADAAAKLQSTRDAQTQKSEESATYWLSPAGASRLEAPSRAPGTPYVPRGPLSDVEKAKAKQMIEIYGQKAAGKSAIANDRQQFINEYAAEHDGARPTSEQIVNWEAERSGKITEAGAVGRRAGGIAVAVEETRSTIPNVLAAAEQSAGKGLATWNKIENKWQVEKGDENFAYYVQQMNSLVNLYGRVISGGGKGTVSDLEHAREMLNPNMPLSAVKGSIRGFKVEVGIAEEAPGAVRAKMRGTAPPSAATPDTGSNFSDRFKGGDSAGGWTDLGNGVRIREKQ